MTGIIDFHAHIFPDKIAHKAAKSISNYYGIKMAHDGTVGELIKSGRRAGIGRYVVHSPATCVEQVRPINDFIAAAGAAHPEFVCFATLHPDMGDIGREVDRIESLGFKGVKMHPEFQGFAIDGGNMTPVYEALEGRLPLLIHMGDRNGDFSSPERLSRVLDRFPRLVVIAAHFGGYAMWDLSSRHLAGRNLYMDTSSTLAFLDPAKAAEMIRKHGADKMLFGTDYPMWDHARELERFMRLGLNEEERAAILHENARRLLFG